MTRAGAQGRSSRARRVWAVLNIAAGLYLMVFGGFIVAVGEVDDSPGLGGLGLITMGIGAVIIFRTLQGRRRSRTASE